MTILLMSPKNMQDTPTYEEALKLLVDNHEGQEVVADRDLFESGAQRRKNWKSVYGGAEKIYVLSREDGTVGKGVYQQWLYLSESLSERRGVPAVVLFGGSERGWYERFSLEVVGRGDGGEGDDMERYSVARLSVEGRAAME